MTATNDKNESGAASADNDESVEEAAAQLAAEAVSSVADDIANPEKLREQNIELQDRVLRIQAELENFRRRSRKEASDSIRYQSIPVIRDLLPGIDNLHRAIDAAESSGDTQNLIEGVKMVAKQFQDVLASHSATPIDPIGESFDPNLHEALSQVPSADHEPMTVIQVVESGYQIHDRMIRPAKVIVSCAPPQPQPDNSAGDDAGDSEA